MIRRLTLLIAFGALAACAASSSPEGFSDEDNDSKNSKTYVDAGATLEDAAFPVVSDGGSSSTKDAGAHPTSASDGGTETADAGETTPEAGPIVIDSGTTPPPPVWPADPFTVDTSCTAMSFAELATRFAAGATSANVPNFTVVSRTRASCNAVTGCSAWTNSPATLMQDYPIDGTNYEGKPHQMSGGGLMILQLDTLDSPPRINLQTWVAEPSTSASFYVPFNGPIQGVTAGSLTSDSDEFQTPAGDSPFSFYEIFDDAPDYGNTSDVTWTGRICDDGHYQFVSELAAQLGTDVSGANNTSQIAYYGQL